MSNGKADGPPPEFWHFTAVVNETGIHVTCDKRPFPTAAELGPVVWTADVRLGEEMPEPARAHVILHLSAILRETMDVDQMVMIQQAVALGENAGK